MTTASALIRFLETLPADTEVRVRVGGETKPLNGLLKWEHRDEAGTTVLDGPVVLSGNYYGA